MDCSTPAFPVLSAWLSIQGTVSQYFWNSQMCYLTQKRSYFIIDSWWRASPASQFCQLLGAGGWMLGSEEGAVGMDRWAKAPFPEEVGAWETRWDFVGRWEALGGVDERYSYGHQGRMHCRQGRWCPDRVSWRQRVVADILVKWFRACASRETCQGGREADEGGEAHKMLSQVGSSLGLLPRYNHTSQALAAVLRGVCCRLRAILQSRGWPWAFSNR